MHILERMKAHGNEKSASRIKDNPRRKTNKTGSVGATSGASREDDNRAWKAEKGKLEQAHSESIEC
jgi:hypothetical protein